MTKKTRTLLFSFIILAAVFGGRGLYRMLQNTEEEIIPEPQAESVILSSSPSADLRSVQIENTRGSLVFTSIDGENWSVNDIPPFFRPDTDKISGTISSLSAIRSRDIITKEPTAEELGLFGLKPPVATVTLKDRSGTSTAVEFGRSSPSGSGIYARRQDSDTVVLVPSYTASAAVSGRDAYREAALPAVNLEDLSEFSYRTGGRLFAVEPLTREDPYRSLAGRFTVVSPWEGRYGLEDSELQKVLTEENPLPVQVHQWYDNLSPDNPELGLNPDTADLLNAADAQGGRLSLIVGAPVPGSETGARYVMFADREDAVFSLTDNDLGILSVDPFRLTTKFVFLASITKVDEVKVQRDSETWIMRRTERGKPDDTEDDRFQINSLEVPREDFTRVYQGFISLMWEGIATKTVPVRTPEVRIVVGNVDDSVEPAVIRFWSYDDTYYRAAVNDGPLEFLVGQYQVQDFVEDLAALAEFGS